MNTKKPQQSKDHVAFGSRNLSVTGNVALDQDLAVAGDETVAGNPSVTQKVTAADVRFTTPKNRWFSHASFVDVANVHAYQIEYWTLGNTSTVLTIPVIVENDELIKEFGVYVVKNSDATDTLTARLWRINDNGTKTQIGADATNNDNAPGPTLVYLGGLNETVGSSTGVGYVMTLERSDVTPSGAVLVNGAYI
jgi:hypothetical protein